MLSCCTILTASEREQQDELFDKPNECEILGSMLGTAAEAAIGGSSFGIVSVAVSSGSERLCRYIREYIEYGTSSVDLVPDPCNILSGFIGVGFESAIGGSSFGTVAFLSGFVSNRLCHYFVLEELTRYRDAYRNKLFLDDDCLDDEW